MTRIHDDRQRPLRPDEELRVLLDWFLRGRQPDALQRMARQGRQPLERQGEVAAPLVPRHRVDLVHDHGAHAAQRPPRPLRSENQIERLGGGDEDVRRLLHHRLPFCWGRVARAQQDPQVRVGQPRGRQRSPNLLERLGQVLLDVVGERLERQVVDRGEESREGLARAGGSGDQNVAPRLEQGPGATLWLGRLGESSGEPPVDDRMEPDVHGESPRIAAIRSTVSPILLFGVEAPAVMPMRTGPCSSHASRRASSRCPTGRYRMLPVCGSMQSASSMWKVGTRDAQMAARCVVLLELYPPITTIASSGSSISLSTASCRSCVAEQMVSKVRKWSASAASPQRRAMLACSSPAIASDSLESIVVWLATPIFTRSRSGSKPGETACAKRSSSCARVTVPSRNAHTSRASSMCRTMMYFPPGYLVTWLAVAFVSSWKYLPWITAV